MSGVDSTKHSKVSNRLHYWVRYLTLGRLSVNCVSLVLPSCCKIHTILEFLPLWYFQLKYGFCKKLLWCKWTSDQLNTFVLTFFQTSTDLDKKWGKKCSTGQRFIWIEVTFYNIHTLANKQGIWIKQGSSFIR